MRIGDSPQGPRLPGRRKVGSDGADGTKSSSGTSSSPSADQASSEQPAELNDLLVQLRQIPDIREEVIEEVEQRLKNGSMLTREAAEATAQKILEQLANQEAEA